MRGLVIKSTGSWYQVQDELGNQYDCRIKGKFRTKGIKTTNPIAVGDWVNFELEADQNTGIITELEPRRNYIIRKSVNLSKQTQIIGANLDQAILVVTLASPPTSLGFIDRFLVTAEAYSIPAILVFNKLDLFSDEGLEILADYRGIYEKLGYPCYQVSAAEGTNIDDVIALLKDKVTLVSGHSGVGKSTLINSIVPKASLRTGNISDSSDKGKHTTTFAEMIQLPFGGKLIDTPGIRELGIVDIEKQELSHFFPEMRAFLNKCRFNNCIHINEPGCVVLDAVEAGHIESSRYESYISMYNNDDNRS
ncbi:ribosome small subunit-dependent GTPase A [Sphingobacterium bovistauri]|uniref:Small ribosomal subunit biogenesis GTPase RsgA n=1 Tax=Sphingobacterium bovistauri TaxID=2781959 RepID=A0ABS7Z6W4_9SPHI|nr:ribosome small subunit-dependent GTPase A [Sphingobacterium bovistauri]MCA5005887.1 ribosome small subunit-dependent GTPase A [Sphingobacterium bovistauri]